MTRVALSPAAASRVAAIRNRKGRPDARLRLVIDGGGCGGFQIRFELADGAGADEVELATDTIPIVIHRQCLPLIDGSTILYEEGLGGSGLKLDNPQALMSCSCGTSFAVAFR